MTIKEMAIQYSYRYNSIADFDRKYFLDFITAFDGYNLTTANQIADLIDDILVGKS
jgi:hypothetical protein